ncbi:ABC transporter ATP-binding protein [Melioribacter sp. OK-6-Me]|uniref:ABC transporter ATP-binding protein n=1 Tax=Melioribacter sp. OK-6-Me TaxID=3423433 RepID=UPI003ED9BC10
MNEKIIIAEGIRKSFRISKNKSLEILKGISLEIDHGKITMIVGASGAGKSTLLHILGGLDRPDSGKVLIDLQDISKMSDAQLSKFRNKKIGFIFQFHHLLPEFTAEENIAIPMMLDGKSYSKAVERSRELLKIVGLSDRSSHKPSELSGGEQQRVAVARALANNPSIIFADEPTGNLDSANGEIIHSLFKELKTNHGFTFLIVSHNPELIRLGDVVHEIKDGTIIDGNLSPV